MFFLAGPDFFLHNTGIHPTIDNSPRLFAVVGLHGRSALLAAPALAQGAELVAAPSSPLLV